MPRLFKSIGVGGMASLLSFVLLCVAVQLAGYTPAQANVPTLAAGSLVQFFGNRQWTFGSHGALPRQLALFLGVEAVSLSLNDLLFTWVVAWGGSPYPLARILVTTAVFLGLSFPAWGRIFR